MKKALYILLSLFALCLLLTGIVGTFIYIRRVPLLTEYLSQKMGTTVHVGAVDVSWNTITIERIKVDNPQGYKLPVALQIELLSLETPLSEYFKKHIVIDTVTLKNVYLGIEFKDSNHTRGNWTQLISNIDSNNSSTEPTGKAPPTPTKSVRHQRTVLIKKLLFLNIDVDLMLSGDSSPRRLSTIQKIELDNVNSEEGLPTEEITEVIVQKLMEQVTSLKGIANMLLKVPASAAKTVLKPFSIIFGGGN